MAKLTTWLTLLLAASVQAQRLVTVSVCLSYSVTEVVTVTSFEGVTATTAPSASQASNGANPLGQASTGGLPTADAPSGAPVTASGATNGHASGTIAAGGSGASVGGNGGTAGGNIGTAIATFATGAGATAATAATTSAQNGLAAPAVTVDPELLQQTFYITFTSSASEDALEKRQYSIVQYLGFANFLSVLYPVQALAAMMYMSPFGLQSGTMFLAMDGMRFVLQVFPPIVPVVIVMAPGGGMMIPGTQGFCTMGNQLNVIPNYGTAPGGCQAVSPGLEAAPSVKTTTTTTTTTTKKTTTTTKKTTTTTKKTTTTTKTTLRTTTTPRTSSKTSSAKLVQTTAAAVQAFTPVDTCPNYPAPIPTCDAIRYTGRNIGNYIDWSIYFSGYGVSGTAIDGSANANRFYISGSVNLCDAFYQCLRQFESTWLVFGLYKMKSTGDYLCMWGQAVSNSFGGNDARPFTMVNPQVEQAYGWIGCGRQTCQPKYCNTFFTPGSVLPSLQIAVSTSRSTSTVKSTSRSSTKSSSSSAPKVVTTFTSTSATTTVVKALTSATPGFGCDYSSDAGCAAGSCGSCFLPWASPGGWQYGRSYCVSSFTCSGCNTDDDCTRIYGSGHTCGYHRSCNWHGAYNGNSCGRALPGVCPYSPLMLPATSKSPTAASSSVKSTTISIKSVTSNAPLVSTSFSGATSTTVTILSATIQPQSESTCQLHGSVGCTASCSECFVAKKANYYPAQYCINESYCHACWSDNDCAIYGPGFSCGITMACGTSNLYASYPGTVPGSACARSNQDICPYNSYQLAANARAASTSKQTTAIGTTTVSFDARLASASIRSSTSSLATSTQGPCLAALPQACSKILNIGSMDYNVDVYTTYLARCYDSLASWQPPLAAGILDQAMICALPPEGSTGAAMYLCYQMAALCEKPSAGSSKTNLGTTTFTSTAIGLSAIPSATKLSCIPDIPQECLSLAQNIASYDSASPVHSDWRARCIYQFQRLYDVIRTDIYMYASDCFVRMYDGTPGSATVACLQNYVCAAMTTSAQRTLGTTAFTFDGRLNPTTSQPSSSPAADKALCVNSLPQDCTDMAIDGWASLLPGQAIAMQLCQNALNALSPFVAEMPLITAWSCTSPPPGTLKSVILQCLRDAIVCGPTSTSVQTLTTGPIVPTYNPYSSEALTAYSTSAPSSQGPCLSVIPQACSDINMETYSRDISSHQYALQGCRNAVLALKSFLGEVAFFQSWACAFPETGTSKTSILTCLENAMVCSSMNNTGATTRSGTTTHPQTNLAATTTQPTTTTKSQASPCVEFLPGACASVSGMDSMHIVNYEPMLQQCRNALTPLLADEPLLKAYDCLLPGPGMSSEQIYACVQSVARCGYTSSSTTFLHSTTIGWTTWMNSVTLESSTFSTVSTFSDPLGIEQSTTIGTSSTSASASGSSNLFDAAAFGTSTTPPGSSTLDEGGPSPSSYSSSQSTASEEPGTTSTSDGTSTSDSTTTSDTTTSTAEPSTTMTTSSSGAEDQPLPTPSSSLTTMTPAESPQPDAETTTTTTGAVDDAAAAAAATTTTTTTSSTGEAANVL